MRRRADQLYCRGPGTTLRDLFCAAGAIEPLSVRQLRSRIRLLHWQRNGLPRPAGKCRRQLERIGRGAAPVWLPRDLKGTVPFVAVAFRAAAHQRLAELRAARPRHIYLRTGGTSACGLFCRCVAESRAGNRCARGVVHHDIRCFSRTDLTQERARRIALKLNDEQIRKLDRWGYPYVLSQYQFHMTLTGKFRRVAVRQSWLFC